MDVLERLDEIAALKQGDRAPEWLSEINGWGSRFSAMCRDAAAEIRHLRGIAGAVSRGQSLSDIRALKYDSAGIPHPVLKAFDGA